MAFHGGESQKSWEIFLINLIGEKKTQNDDALERLQKKEEKLTNKRRKKRGASKNNWPLS